MTPDMIAALVGAVLGSGTAGSVTSWVLSRIDRHRDMLTRSDLDAALEASPVLHALGDRVHDLELDQLRDRLMVDATNRQQQERQLEDGKRYLELGGNGTGHARLDVITDDYERRLRDDDWDYERRTQ